MEAAYLHYCIQKLHWSPSEVLEFVESDSRIKAFYYASIDLKIKRDKEEADKIKKSAK